MLERRFNPLQSPPCAAHRPEQLAIGLVCIALLRRANSGVASTSESSLRNASISWRYKSAATHLESRQRGA